MFGDETVLRSLLHLRRSSRYMVDACMAPSGPYVVVKCPGGLSLLACDVEPLEALATAVMDARAALPGMYDPATGLMSEGNQQAWWYRSRKAITGGLEAHKQAFVYASE